jgi:hypothetical protein
MKKMMDLASTLRFLNSQFIRRKYVIANEVKQSASLHTERSLERSFAMTDSVIASAAKQSPGRRSNQIASPCWNAQGHLPPGHRGGVGSDICYP